MIAAVLIRGIHDREYSVLDALKSLRLQRKHVCVLLTDTPSNRGQLQKVKDFVTWGTITDETRKLLVSKRGKPAQGPLTDSRKKIHARVLKMDGKTLLPYFNLQPPRGGFGRKGIKVGFSAGGALGDRKEAMNKLITRMI